MAHETFPDALAAALARTPGRPLVTFYDDATGERVELSVTTYANWVAKTAGLLQDELFVERGSTVLIDLPTHWLGPVWLGAAWSVGAAVTDDGTVDGVDLVVCGPDTVAAHASGEAPVVALSLLPMGTAFRHPLPAGVVDYGRVVWGQPDAFFPDEPPEPDDVAWRDDSGARTQRDLLAAVPGEGDEPRLLTDTNPSTAAGLETLLGPLLAGGGTVWVRHADPDGWDRRAAAEQATRVLRDQPRS
ncbi:TIGR03089 family protein [Nocardioides caldifontis]|uniref:TIGR03089 family protein n=1 Tax=Nocardioides caldifontis TaxID=2588938 RepID=UPI0011DF549A|nr:TIGR03089 family protein [Nocardioides caldifontis]